MAASKEQRSELVEEGIKIARERRAELGRLIETDPTLQDSGSLATDGSANGSPVPVDAGGGVFEYYIVRRKDHETSGSVSYTVQFSDNLTGFTNSVATPTFVVNSSADPGYEVVKVPFPGGYRFGRLQIEVVP